MKRNTPMILYLLLAFNIISTCFSQELLSISELEEIEFVDRQISLEQSKRREITREDSVKDLQIENKFFNLGQNLFLKSTIPKEIIHLEIIYGVTSKLRNIDQYQNQYIFIGNKTHISIQDLSGAVIVEHKFEFTAVKFVLTQGNRKSVPKIYVLSDKNVFSMFMINFKKTSQTNSVDYTLKLKSQFNIWDNLNITSSKEDYSELQKLQKKPEILIVKEQKQVIYFIFSDKENKIQ